MIIPNNLSNSKSFTFGRQSWQKPSIFGLFFVPNEGQLGPEWIKMNDND